MIDKKDLFFTQSFITEVADVSPSTLNKFINQNKFPHIAKFGEKRKKYNFSTTRDIIKRYLTKNLVPTKKIQVFFNFKGGTGKTSLCHQISVKFALMGFNTLVIDCDPQAHLSYSLGFDENDDNITLYDVIVNKVPIQDAIQNVYPGLDCIPSNLSLTRLELPLNQMPNRERVLSKTLDPLKEQYDFIFIDTNPTISTLNRNVTLAADILNIVCETQPYSLKGLEMLIEEINNFSEAMETNIHFRIIPNKYEAKTATSQEAVGTLRYYYKDHVLESIIRKCEDLNISAKKRMPVYGFCSKKSIALEDIRDLTKEILKYSTEKI